MPTRRSIDLAGAFRAVSSSLAEMPGPFSKDEVHAALATTMRELVIGGGEPYINIGTPRACCFMPVSLFMCSRLKSRPLLFRAMEEGVRCAEHGYYAGAIIIFSQLMNLLRAETPDVRHDVAHCVLEHLPTQAEYESVRRAAQDAARSHYEREKSMHPNLAAYVDKLQKKWAELIDFVENAAH